MAFSLDGPAPAFCLDLIPAGSAFICPSFLIYFHTCFSFPVFFFFKASLNSKYLFRTFVLTFRKAAIASPELKLVSTPSTAPLLLFYPSPPGAADAEQYLLHPWHTGLSFPCRSVSCLGRCCSQHLKSGSCGMKLSQTPSVLHRGVKSCHKHLQGYCDQKRLQSHHRSDAHMKKYLMVSAPNVQLAARCQKSWEGGKDFCVPLSGSSRQTHGAHFYRSVGERNQSLYSCCLTCPGPVSLEAWDWACFSPSPKSSPERKLRSPHSPTVGRVCYRLFVCMSMTNQ